MGNPGIEAELSDPYQSGLDLDANCYMLQEFYIANPQNAFVGIVSSLKDKAAFQKLVSSKGNFDIKSGDGFEYFQPNRNTIVSWNNSIAVMGMSQGFGGDLKAGVSKVYNTTKETSIANNADLKKCFSKNADMVSWFSSDGMAEGAKGNMGMEMAMAGFSPDMLVGNYAHTYTNFENGEIVSTSEYEINEKLSQEFRHIFKDEVKTDFSKYLPAENLAFAFAAGLDIKGFKMILDNKGISGMADFQLKEFGLSMAGIAKTFEGDILVSGYRVEGSETPTMMVATKINDKDNFQKIICIEKEYNMIASHENGV